MKTIKIMTKIGSPNLKGCPSTSEIQIYLKLIEI